MILLCIIPVTQFIMSSFNSKTYQAPKPVVLAAGDWDTTAHKYMPPKVNAQGGKAINLISCQTNRSLHVTTPLMMTWGIQDFVNEHGEHDDKFSVTLNFPNDDYASDATSDFLSKMKAFENQILDDAVKNSEQWWGESMSKELCKHTFFPFLKYRKDKDTKKLDFASPPSIRAKVPKYGDKWAIELYDTESTMIFPCDDPDATPPDFVPKLSNIACVLQCGGVWIGGKGWGLTWKMVQGVVKPRVNNTIYGKCQIQLSSDDVDKLNKQVVEDDVEDVVVAAAPSVEVDDSDDEDENVEVEEAAPVPAPVKKKVVKKKVAAVPVVAEPVVADAAQVVKKKKVVKKKVAVVEA